MKKINVLIAVLILAVVSFSSTAFAKQGGTSGGKGSKITSLDDFPSKIAGDPGVVTGTWSSPYVDAANATDGDYSTYASGRMLGIDIEPVEAYITWDMGQVFDVSIVTIKYDIIPSDTFNFNMTISLEYSRDNITWGYTDINIYYLSLSKEMTGFVPSRSRYIRLKCVAYNVSDGEIRIYEIKVR